MSDDYHCPLCGVRGQMMALPLGHGGRHRNKRLCDLVEWCHEQRWSPVGLVTILQERDGELDDGGVKRLLDKIFGEPVTYKVAQPMTSL